MSVAMETFNVVAVILTIVATLVAIWRLRASRLALWLLVIWLLPVIGPLIYLAASKGE